MVLTVQEALDMAQEGNLSLQAQQISVDTALLQEANSWNVLIPSLTGTLGYLRSNRAQSGSALVPDPSSFDPLAGGFERVSLQEYEASPHTIMGKLDVQLTLNPALGNGMVALAQGSELAVLERESLWQDTALSVEKNFYQILLLQEQMAILEAQMETMTQRLKDRESMYQSGLITELDLLQVQVGLERMKPGISSLKAGIEGSLNGLKLTLGLDQETDLILEGSIAGAHWSQESGTLSEAPKIQKLELNQRMMKNGLKASKNQKLPSLILGWSYNPVLNDPFTENRYLEGDNWTDQGSFSLMMALPLSSWLPHSKDQIDRIKQTNDLLALGLQKRLALQGLKVQLNTLERRLLSQEESISAAQKGLDLAQRSYQLTERAYQVGTKTFLELQTAEDDYLSAQFELVNTQYDYLITQLEGKHLLGQF